MIEPVIFMKEGEVKSPVEGALALPPDSGPAPAVLVVHEFFGLNDHIRSLTERIAAAGFVALAVDLYEGKVAERWEDAAQLAQAMKTPRSMEVIAGAVLAVQAHPRCSGKVGITGFCLGGAMTLAAVCNVAGLLAAVPFYGLPMAQYLDFGKARSHPPIQGHYAQSDPHVTRERVVAVMEAARAAGFSVETCFYEGGHGFMRDSDPAAYHAPSAELAWQRMVDFFRKHLF